MDRRLLRAVRVDDSDALAFERPFDLGPGSPGEDRITVRGGSDIVDGQAGADRYRIENKGAENSARVTVWDSGIVTSEIDRLTINGTARDDQFLLRAATDPEGLAFVASINRGMSTEPWPRCALRSRSQRSESACRSTTKRSS